MTKEESIKLLLQQRDLIDDIKNKYKEPEFDKWKRDTRVIIQNIFCGDQSGAYVKEFESIKYSLSVFSTGTPESSFKRAFEKGLDKAKVLIESLIEEIQKFGVGDEAMESTDFEKQKKKKIFISHSSLNRNITDKFVMLLKRLGVYDEQVYYSSFVETGAKYLDDCFESITKEFRESELMIIFMLSREFYNSNVCLAEMGATWVAETKHIPIILPPLEFGDVKGVIKPTQNGIMLCDGELSQKLDGLKETIEEYLEIENKISITEWNREKEVFISEIKSISEQDNEIISTLRDINIDKNKCLLKIEIKNNTRSRYRCESLNVKLFIKNKGVIETTVDSWVISSIVLQSLEDVVIFIEVDIDEAIKKSAVLLKDSKVEVVYYEEA